MILRGLAWAGHRDNLDEFCTPEELSSLRYPEGGPQKPAETLANLEVHPDFDMSLVVAEPLINNGVPPHFAEAFRGVRTNVLLAPGLIGTAKVTACA